MCPGLSEAVEAVVGSELHTCLEMRPVSGAAEPVSRSWEHDARTRRGWCHEHTRSGEESVLPRMGNVPNHGYLDFLLCNHNEGLKKETVDRKALRSPKESEKCKAVVIGLWFLFA